MKRAADDNALEELGRAKAVLEGHGPGGDMRKLLKQPTPALLTLLLGQQCNLVTLQVQHPHHSAGLLHTGIEWLWALELDA